MFKKAISTSNFLINKEGKQVGSWNCEAFVSFLQKRRLTLHAIFVLSDLVSTLTSVSPALYGAKNIITIHFYLCNK